MRDKMRGVMQIRRGNGIKDSTPYRRVEYKRANRPKDLGVRGAYLRILPSPRMSLFIQMLQQGWLLGDGVCMACLSRSWPPRHPMTESLSGNMDLQKEILTAAHPGGHMEYSVTVVQYFVCTSVSPPAMAPCSSMLKERWMRSLLHIQHG